MCRRIAWSKSKNPLSEVFGTQGRSPWLGPPIAGRSSSNQTRMLEIPPVARRLQELAKVTGHGPLEESSFPEFISVRCRVSHAFLEGVSECPTDCAAIPARHAPPMAQNMCPEIMEIRQVVMDSNNISRVLM